MAYSTFTSGPVEADFNSARHAHERGELQHAIAGYRHVLSRSPSNAQAILLLGTALLQLGDAAGAIEYLEGAARQLKGDPRVLGNLAQGYLALERFNDAAEAFRKASRLAPREPQVQVGLAAALALGGKLDEAHALLKRLTTRFPSEPLVWVNFGNVLRDLRRTDEAITAYRRACTLDAHRPDALNSIGSLLHQAGRWEEAEAQYRACITADSNFLPAQYNLASLLIDRGRYREAEEVCRTLCTAADGVAEFQLLLGTALGHQSRLVDALACYQRAVALAPNDARCQQALGGALVETGRTLAGLQWLRRAHVQQPADAPLRRVFAGALLGSGLLSDGWSFYAARSGAQELQKAHAAWNPEIEPPPTPSDRDVCVLAEQGIGDELFFMRYAPALAGHGARVRYTASPKVAPLLERTLPFQQIAESPKTGFRILAGDLPRLLSTYPTSLRPSAPARTSADAQPPLPEYRFAVRIFYPPPPGPLELKPLPERLTDIAARLRTLGSPPYVGITWQAGTAPVHQQASSALFKSIPLHELGHTLRDLPGTLISLQRQPDDGARDALSTAAGKPIADCSELNDDLEGMLALLSLLDDYVGVSNTNMHLRAGVGRTARVLVPSPAEWRWLGNGSHSPWFPGFAIYRQSIGGDWEPALQALRHDLRTTLKPSAE